MIVNHLHLGQYLVFRNIVLWLLFHNYNQHYQNKNRDEEKEFNKNFIKTGTSNPSWNNDTHYDPEDPTTSSGNKFGRWSKPINKGLTGKMGRALGMGAAKAAVGARHAYNKIRGAYNN